MGLEIFYYSRERESLLVKYIYVQIYKRTLTLLKEYRRVTSVTEGSRVAHPNR